MELSSLKGNIVGVIGDVVSDEPKGLIKNIVTKKTHDALKMVGLDDSILDKDYNGLSSREKAKVKVASKLQDKEIVLCNISKGLTKKDMDFFKSLFKKIINYNRRIFLVDKNSYLFLECCQNICVISDGDVIFTTDDIYDKRLERFIDVPKIVEFVNKSEKMGIKINHYLDIDELLKAIYRIKS